MKRTAPVIFAISFFLGIALPGAADSPRPAAESSKSSPPAGQPVERSKTPASDAIAQVLAEMRNQPSISQPRSAGGSITGVTLSWSSVSSGGIVEGTVPGSRLSASAGQPVVLQGTNPGFVLSGGFWYGAQGCNCPDQFDFNSDGFWDSLDLSLIIDAIFFSGPVIHDLNCPLSRSDANCDGFTDSIDLSYMIDLIFLGGGPPCNPCSQ